MISKNLSLCYQCAKCSAGCPLAPEMDILPHRIIHYAALGMEEMVLKSATPWICASCHTCAVRCPNGVNITDVMDRLRSLAAARPDLCPKPEVLMFHRNFLKDLMRRGRIHEARMMGEYNLKTGHPLRNMALALKFLLHQRLRVLPPQPVKHFKKWIRTLWPTHHPA